jgi:MFS transporter, PPP family, 3-phenylpropionic acid transporter
VGKVPPSARSYHVRMAAFYAATFLVVGSNGPYLPVWLDWRGLSSWQISIVLAAPMFGRIVFTPLISFLADRSGQTRRILIGLAWGTLASCLAFASVERFVPILLVATLYAAFWTTVIPLSEVIAMAGVRRLGLDYGRMRLWGSISFIAASVGGGFAIAASGPQAALWVLTAAALATVLAAFCLPHPTANGESGKKDGETRGLRLADAAALARTPLFLLFVAASSLSQASHAVFYAFGTLHLQKQGLSAAWIGILWAVGVVCEIGLFSVSGALVARFGAVRLMLIGALAGAIRWPLMALDPHIAVLAPLQALHGLTFGATHLGAIHFMNAAIPASHAGTAQGLFATMTGAMMGLALICAGPLYAALAGGAYAVMTVPAVMAVAGGLLLSRLWRLGPIVSTVSRPA